MPEISSFNSKSTFKDYSNENCCVIIGCAEFINKTNDFHISESNKKNPHIVFKFSAGNTDSTGWSDTKSSVLGFIPGKTW